jgi:hypothetical protein
VQPGGPPAGQLQPAQDVLVGADHVAQGDRPLHQVAQVGGLDDHGQAGRRAGHVGAADLLGQVGLLAADLVGGRLQGDVRVGPPAPGRGQLGGGDGQPLPGPDNRLVGGGQGGRDRAGVGPGVAQHPLDLAQAATGLGQLVPLVRDRRVGEQHQRRHRGDQRDHPRPYGHAQAVS